MPVDTLSRVLRGATNSDHNRKIVRGRSVPRCVASILVLKTALALVGFERTARWIRRRAVAVATSANVDAHEVANTVRAVALAAAFFPGRALCLERSLVLYYLLRRSGIAAHLRFGVQTHPFTAHAWVEYQGEPINDSREVVKMFAPLPELDV